MSVRRAVAILFSLWIFALGSGLALAMHNAQHAREDAAEAAAAKAAGLPVPDDHDHDDSNCPVHAQLHLPLLAAGWVPLLVFLGLLVAFLTLLEAPLVGARFPQRVDCRGPPSFPCVG